MVAIWVNPDGSITPISSPQDVAAALDKDPEVAEALAEEISEEIKNEGT